MLGISSILGVKNEKEIPFQRYTNSFSFRFIHVTTDSIEKQWIIYVKTFNMARSSSIRIISESANAREGPPSSNTHAKPS